MQGSEITRSEAHLKRCEPGNGLPILLIDQHYWPGSATVVLMLTDLAEYLAEQGSTCTCSAAGGTAGPAS